VNDGIVALWGCGAVGCEDDSHPGRCRSRAGVSAVNNNLVAVNGLSREQIQTPVDASLPTDDRCLETTELDNYQGTKPAH